MCCDLAARKTQIARVVVRPVPANGSDDSPKVPPRLLVLGSVAYDVIMRFPDSFFRHVDVHPEMGRVNAALTVTERHARFGGTAGNIAYNLGLLGVPHAVASSVGRDFEDLGYSDHFLSTTRTLLLDVHEDEHTATCYVVNDSTNNQLIVFHEGASRLGVNLDLDARLDDPECSGIELATNSVQNPVAMVKFADVLHERRIPFAFDPGQVVRAFNQETLEDVLSKAAYLFVNEHEFHAMASILGFIDAGGRAANAGPQERNDAAPTATSDEPLAGSPVGRAAAEEMCRLVPVVVVTRGAEGAEVHVRGKGVVKVPASRPRAVVETTGAGDGFRAGFLAAILAGADPVDATRLGNVVASFVVETEGAQTQKYGPEEVRARYDRDHGGNAPLPK
ncbi:MAG: carbohydrate kinase family protein [Promethearchaeota archaeon]